MALHGDVTSGSPPKVAGTDDTADRGLTLFDVGKPVALITYLACAPDRSAVRQHIVDLLWSDAPDDAAKHALRQTVWYLKKRVGDYPLITGGDVITLSRQLRFDRDEFLAAAERGDAQSVVRLYTGDFFPGFAAPGGAEFERWVDAERHRLRSIFWQSAELVTRQWLSSARTKDAQTLARRVRDLDLLREAGWRLLFETIIAGRDTVAASVEVQSFERLFDSEGIEPEPATRALLRALRHSPEPNDALPADGSHAITAALVGREREFSHILSAWDTARIGRPSHVHVLASAGLGKSRLLNDLHARLRASRARTVLTRATLGARDIPYGFIGELAHALARLPGASGISPGSARTLVALNPAVSSFFPSVDAGARDDPSDALRRRTAAVRELLIVLAEEQALAVFIDDLQWADAASRQVLAGVHGTLGGARTLLVTAGRPNADTAHSPAVTDLLSLEPLAKESVVELLASIAALPSEPWSEQLPIELWHATAGSPLLILETLQLAVERGLLERLDGEWNAPRPHDLLAVMQAGGALRHRVERLDRPDRWLLTILAVAGSPLSTGVIAGATERTVDEAELALVALEHRGLVVRQGASWSPSHDEIAAMAIELSADTAVRAAAKVVGRAIISEHTGDLRLLRQAGSLLDRAQDQEGLAHAFNLFARAARSAGDRRSNHTLAHEFIGERLNAVTRWLVRSLPITHRLGLYSTRRQVAGVAATVMLPLTVAVMQSALGSAAAPPPDAVLLAGWIATDSTARLYTVPIRGSGLTVGQVIQLVPRRRVDWTFKIDPMRLGFVPVPDGKGWLGDRVMPDSGGIELFELDARGGRRLTTQFGDDEAPSPSPDGRALAFHTARWDPRSRYDLAVMDRESGNVRQLTRTGDSDMVPTWSPDGTRIAFTRHYWDGRKSVACVIDVDGTDERCYSVPGQEAVPLRAWYDVDHLLVVLRGTNDDILARLDVVTGVIDTIIQAGPTVFASPDGRWIAMPLGQNRDTYRVFPTDAPNRAVQVDLSKLPPGRRFVVWATSPTKRLYVDRAGIDAGWGPVTVGRHRVFAVGLSPSGDTVEARRVTWRSMDTTVATIDSLGTLTAKHAGTVEIEASLGGWRSVRQRVTIEDPRVSVLLHETWSDGIRLPWRAFGIPTPRIDSTPAGQLGMMNAGDGSHSSGVYTEREYSTARGLALDVRIAAAISDEQWQVISAQLIGSLDSGQLANWDHKTGGPPVGEGHDCGLSYPNGREGVGWGDSIWLGPRNQGAVIAAPSAFRTGAWFAARVQLFPDGRCGVAINGVPVTLSSPRAIWKPIVRVTLFGNSMWTKMLVGETTLREGVPTDIDWSAASTQVSIPVRPP